MTLKKDAEMIEMSANSKESDSEKKEQKQRYRVQDALHFLNKVQEMELLDADEIRNDEKTVQVLTKTRDVINGILSRSGSGKMSRRDALKEAEKLGFREDDE